MRFRLSPSRLALPALAVILTGAVVFHVWSRGPERYPLYPVWTIPEADPAIGRRLVIERGCVGCHVIPGIPTAVGRVGPQLTDFRQQTYIAGLLPNTPDNLVEWIRNPQHISPRSAMPDLGLTEAEARHVAAYLYAQ